MSFALMVVLKSTIVLACGALMATMSRRASASLRHAIWALALSGAVGLPVLTALVPQYDLPLLPEAVTRIAFLSAESLTGPEAASTAPAARQWSLLQWTAVVWALGFLGMAVRLLLSGRAMRRLLKDATAPSDRVWHELTGRLQLEFGIAKQVRLLFSSGPISPMTWGVFRHVILLPDSAMQWNEARRRLVLAHELAHVKRGDGLLQLLAQAVCSLYWFNPAVWYAARRMRVERERACDDHVLNLGENAADYAGHLLEIARGIRGSRALSFAAVSMAQPSQLETRLLSILNPRASRRTLSPVATALLSTLIAAVTTSVAGVGLTAATLPFPPEPPLPTVPGKMFAEPFTIGPDVTAPTVVKRVEPQYTQDARKLRYAGTLVVEAVIETDGSLKVVRVIQALDHGLTEAGVEALEQWKFNPGMRNGEPVPVSLNIEVNFNLR